MFDNMNELIKLSPPVFFIFVLIINFLFIGINYIFYLKNVNSLLNKKRIIKYKL